MNGQASPREDPDATTDSTTDATTAAAVSTRARRDAQRRAIAVLPFTAVLLLVLAIAPIIVASRARAHRRLIADTIEPARIAAGELEAAALHRLLAHSDGRATTEFDIGPGVTPRTAAAIGFKATLDSAAIALGPEASRRVAAFEAALRDDLAPRGPGDRRTAAVLRSASATDSMQAWLDRRISEERAAAVAVERWDVWLPMTLVPLCLLGIIAVAFAGREIATLGRAAQRDATALAEATSAKAALLRGITHDLKNPLGAAQGFTELLTDGVLGEISERPREAVGRVHRLLGVAIASLNELTELSRAESGALTIVMKETRLDRLVAECVADHLSTARVRNLTLVVEPTADAMPIAVVVRSDARRLRQILDNLVSNAIKYTPGSGTVRVTATMEPDGTRARVSVCDTGPGVPRGMRSRVFEEFYRLSRHERDDAADAPTGTGIGLAISRRIARLLGGDLWVDDAVGGGAAFILSVPALPPDTSAPATRAAFHAD